ncbi:MAG TPA: Glu/Leu/Phe/Val dehydrogenase family protein, partial [Acidimicrobiales bacterium]|nr:Glu/Leu/Phe/Val dehydrogenase family protein [Acidimicrobiales bacterium]
GRHTNFVTGRSASSGGSGDPSPLTAYGVVRAMEAAAQALWGSPSLAGRHVAINGIGKVGHTLAELCSDRGARLSIADVSPVAIARARAGLATEVAVTEPAAIHRVDCDVYAPCALGGALNDETVPELGCKVVCGAANNQLATAATESALAARGISYVPDYVANAGGIINIAYERGSYDADAAREHVGRIFDTTARLFEESSRSGEALGVIADRLAEARMAAAGGPDAKR